MKRFRWCQRACKTFFSIFQSSFHEWYLSTLKFNLSHRYKSAVQTTFVHDFLTNFYRMRSLAASYNSCGKVEGWRSHISMSTHYFDVSQDSSPAYTLRRHAANMKYFKQPRNSPTHVW